MPDEERSKDRELAAKAGRKGGEQSHGGGGQRVSQDDNERGGSGNFANDPERASEAGRKDGQRQMLATARSASARRASPLFSIKPGPPFKTPSSHAVTPDLARWRGRIHHAVADGGLRSPFQLSGYLGVT